MKIKSVVVGIALLAAMVARAGSTNDLAGALRNGLFEEQVDHNLEAAIATYQSVVAKFDTDRQLAATAAFRLGECYRTLGRTNEAMAQYQRVLTDFSDQGTLVKLSEQNLAELRGPRPMPQPPSRMSRSDRTNYVNALVQTIADAGKSQQALDELAKLRTVYAGKQAILARLKDLKEEQLKQQLPTIAPDPLLANLLEQLNLEEQKFLKVKGETVPENPEYKIQQELVVRLEMQVTERMKGILASMDTELAGIQAQIKELSAPTPQEEVLRREYQDQLAGNATLTPTLSDFRPTTDEESQEILRIQAMIQNSPDLINAVSGYSTPLITAAQEDHLQVAKFLLEHGADVNAQSNSKETALHAAARNGHKAMVELLLAHGAEVNAQKNSDQHGNGPRTPLDLAVEKNYPAVVEVLLAHEADPNIPGEDQMTPLHRAAIKGSVSLAELLLARGADVNATNVSGRMPLHLAAGNGNAKMVSFLLGKKAEVNARDDEGKTPLFFALKYPEIIKILLANGADVKVRDTTGETALAFAAMNGPAEVVKLLLDAKADTSLGDNAGYHQGWLPLHYAVERGNVDSAEALLRHGADPNAVTKRYMGAGNAWTEGTTPLMLAINNKRPDVVDLLLRFKADPNLTDVDGTSALQVAIGQTNIVDALLRAGADVNKPFKNGFTPLQWAVYSRNRGAVETILAHKPDVNAIAPNGYTALDLIRGQNDLEMAALLRANGALDNVPKYDVIQVSRPSHKFRATIFQKGTNDWNHYTLLELLAAHYGYISTSITNGASYIFFDPNSWAAKDALPFPNLEGIKIWRPTEQGTKAREIDINLADINTWADSSKDVELKWGDVVEIPEADHPIDVKWGGFSTEARTILQECLKRTVQLTVKGQTTNLVLMPNVIEGSSIEFGGRVTQIKKPSFYIWPVLSGSKLLRTSSDLSRVKVTRTDVKTGKKQEWVLDCSDLNDEPDLWLRDGDVVEVGEK